VPIAFKQGVSPADVLSLTVTMLIVLQAAKDWFLVINKPLVMTSLLRQDGVHALGRAVDIRSTDLTEAEVVAFESYMNDKFKAWRGQDKKMHKTCIYHDVGQGVHFHLQVQK